MAIFYTESPAVNGMLLRQLDRALEIYRGNNRHGENDPAERKRLLQLVWAVSIKERARGMVISVPQLDANIELLIRLGPTPTPIYKMVDGTQVLQGLDYPMSFAADMLGLGFRAYLFNLPRVPGSRNPEYLAGKIRERRSASTDSRPVIPVLEEAFGLGDGADTDGFPDTLTDPEQDQYGTSG